MENAEYCYKGKGGVKFFTASAPSQIRGREGSEERRRRIGKKYREDGGKRRGEGPESTPTSRFMTRRLGPRDWSH